MVRHIFLIFMRKKVPGVNNFLILYTQSFLFVCIYFETNSIFKALLYKGWISTIKKRADYRDLFK